MNRTIAQWLLFIFCGFSISSLVLASQIMSQLFYRGESEPASSMFCSPAWPRFISLCIMDVLPSQARSALQIVQEVCFVAASSVKRSHIFNVAAAIAPYFIYLHFMVTSMRLSEMGRKKDGSLFSTFCCHLWRNYVYCPGCFVKIKIANISDFQFSLHSKKTEIT